MSLWTNEESERQQRTQRVMIVVGAAAAAVIVFWVFRNAITLASRPSNGIGFASSGRARRLINGIETESDQPTQSIQYPLISNPGAPTGSASRYVAPAPAARAYIPPPPPPVIGGSYVPSTVIASNHPEFSPEERLKARTVTAPLRQTLNALRDFDRKSFWNGGGNISGADDAVDALGAMVALYGHPDRFPAPMRGTASAAATGMRSYLRLTLDAASSNPDDRQRMRPDATKRLAEADAAVSQLEGASPRSSGMTPGFAN